MAVELDMAAVSKSLGGGRALVPKDSVCRLLSKDFLKLSTLMKLKMENCRWCIYRYGLDQAEGTSISKELLIIDPILQVLSPHIKIGKWMYIYVLNLNKRFKVRMYDILTSSFSFNPFFYLLFSDMIVLVMKASASVSALIFVF